MGSRCSVNGDRGQPVAGAHAGGQFPSCCARVPAERACCSNNLPPEDRTHSVLEDGNEEAGLELPPSVDPAELAILKSRLDEAGIDTSAFGKSGARPLEALYHEIENGHCVLEPIKSTFVHSGTLKRVVEQVQISVVAILDGTEHVLVSLEHQSSKGQRPRKQILVQKLNVDEKWKEGVKQCFENVFDMNSKDQHRHLILDEQSHTYHEHLAVSKSYPALLTQYKLHEVVVFVDEQFAPGLERLGLPDIRSFTTRDCVFDGRAGLRVWSWEESPEVMGAVLKEERQRESEGRGLGRARSRTLSEAVLSLSLGRSTATNVDTLQRVPLPPPLATKSEASHGQTSPNAHLAALVAGKKLDKDALGRAARRIRDEDYSLRAFFDDCSAAFPELRLYLFSPPVPESRGQEQVKAEGEAERKAPMADEYQRTVGALFVFYWLMRADLDGKNGFCYGVDDLWEMRTPPTVSPNVATQKPWMKMGKGEKRWQFYKSGPWDSFQELLFSAGLLHRGSDSSIVVQEERTQAMLALTAVHDVMKIVGLLPRVAPEHAPYGPYEAQEEILVHDMALSYLLEHFPELIPSVHGLPATMQQLVLFTQSKMNFNKSGMLTLAEGPPGELLGTFKKMVQKFRGSSGGGWRSSTCGTQQDVAFYFVHWLTDIAAAVPTPLAGSVRLVIQYPLDSLATVVNTFKVLKRLADDDETTVFEAYLKMRWTEAMSTFSWLGPIEMDGPQAISRCRLLCMAWSAAKGVLEAYDQLPPSDKRFLSEELSATGRRGQMYGFGRNQPSKPGQVSGLKGLVSYTEGDGMGFGGCGEVGPAFLLYHGPAFLQSSSDPDVALQMILSVLRAARAMWPTSPEAADETVTLHLDKLKEQLVEGVRTSLQKGEVWLLVWHSSHEAFVERHQLRMLNDFNRCNKPYQVLVLLSGEQLSSRIKREF